MFDISSLANNTKDILKITYNIDIPKEDLDKVGIIRLESVLFTGNITKKDEYYNIKGTLEGKMYLPDDITLEEVEVPIKVEIDEIFGQNDTINENNLTILENNIDLISFLWQNIVLEVPSKVRGNNHKDIKSAGEGWRLITEDEYKMGNNLGLEELKTLLNKKEEWFYGSTF